MSRQIDISTSEELAQRLNFAEEANKAARQSAFADYRSRRAQNTLRRQDSELANFGEYVCADDLGSNPRAWAGISWGIVESFVKNMLLDGYAMGSVNNHLSTIKTYARLATKAGTISTQEQPMIRMVSGYSHKEGQRIDEKRVAADLETRLGEKTTGFLVLSMSQEEELKASCDNTSCGSRDRVLLVLLLDLGLRVSEAADLQVDGRKTDKTTTFELHSDKLAAMRAYFETGEPSSQMLMGSRKDGRLEGGMSVRAIRARVRKMGETLGIDNLSPHDLRHTRATRLASSKNVRELMDWFGWNSPAMAARYIESAQFITVE